MITPAPSTAINRMLESGASPDASTLKPPATSTTTLNDPLYTARESAAFLTISEPTFWRHVAEGKIPRPIKLGHLSRWPRSELLAVIEHAKAARG